jgi:predicted MFS family arabinose efflux permease
MSRPSRGGASYRAVLALPRARSLLAAALPARLCYGFVPLPLLLTLKQGTHSYAAAGLASGLFGLVTALLGPARARLVERRPDTLVLLACCYAGLLAAIALAGRLGVAPWLAIALACAAGAVPPPVGSLVRTLWGVLTADEAQRQSALSLDTVSESTMFAVGPALAGLVITLTSAPTALAACAVIVVVGFLRLAAVLRGSAEDRQLSEDDPRPQPTPRQSPLRAPGFVPLLVVVLGSSLGLALVVVANVAAWGAGVAGSLEVALSVGGVLGGLLYGRRSWRAGADRRLAVLGLAAACCYPPLALAATVPAAAVVLLVAGAAADTLLVTSYLLVDVLVPEGSRTEAGAWLNTAYNLGSALGTAGAGLLVQSAGTGSAYTAAAAVAGAAALTGLLTVRRSAGPSVPPSMPSPEHTPERSAGSGADDGDLADAQLLQRSGD